MQLKKQAELWIPIRKDSVKKNPNASSYKFHIAGNSETKVEGTIPLPPEIENHPNFHWVEKSDKGFRGYLMNPNDIDFLKNIKGVHIHRTRQINVIHTSSPQPDYFYSHVNKRVQCNTCHKYSNLTEIEREFDYDYDAYLCSKCHDTNSFPKFNYQTIEDFLSKYELITSGKKGNETFIWLQRKKPVN